MQRHGPLTGLKVLELGQFVSGPFTTRLLAEFGADVIKVEAPTAGDSLRQWRLMAGDTSLWWYLQSRNKKSVTLDLRKPEGQEIAHRLAGEVDIIVENFRPGTLEKWGLGWEELHRQYPRLIMVRISGYGQDGPSRDKPGFGSVGECVGGLRQVTGFPDRPPVRLGLSLGDSVAGIYGALGAMMAIYHRDLRGGQGQLIDVARTKAHLLEEILAVCDEAGTPAGRVYTAADMVNDPQYLFREMIRTVELPDGPCKMPGIIPKLSETPGEIDWVGPKLGEHNMEVLHQQLGLSKVALAALRQRQVI